MALTQNMHSLRRFSKDRFHETCFGHTKEQAAASNALKFYSVARSYSYQSDRVASGHKSAVLRNQLDEFPFGRQDVLLLP